MPYEKYLANLVHGPLQGPWGGKYLRAVGRVIDEHTDELIQAARVGMPGAMVGTPAGPGANALTAKERQLEKGPDETEAEYAERLRLAWDTWKEAGSHPALHKQLLVAGFDTPNLFIIQKSGKRTTLTDPETMTVSQGPVWTMDGKAARAYASFALLFTTAQPTLTWSESTGFSADAALLNRIARKWRPAKTEFWGTVILGTGAWYGWPTTRTWGSFNWGGTSTFIPPR